MPKFFLIMLNIIAILGALETHAENLIIDRSAEESSFLINAASKAVGSNTAMWLQRKRPNPADYLSSRQYSKDLLKARFADMEGAKEAMLADCLQFFGMEQLDSCSCTLAEVDFNPYIQAENSRIDTGITFPYHNLQEFQRAEAPLQKVWEYFRHIEKQCKLPKFSLMPSERISQ